MEIYNKTLYKKLLAVKSELKCNKSQYNSFGKYHYRNAEDIVEAVKPLLVKVKATVIISDEIVNIANRFYVKAKATRLVPAHFGFISLTEQLTNKVKHACISRRVTARSTTNGRLINVNNFISMF